MSPALLAALAFGALFLLILLRVPLGIAMMIVGATGFAAKVGVAPARSC